MIRIAPHTFHARALFALPHLILAMLLLLGGCNGSSDPVAPPPSEGSATLDAAGGTVNGPDGVTLSVAADPEAVSTTYRIARDSEGSPTLAGMTLLSPIYAVTPHGSAFNTSALLKLPYDATKVPAGATVVVLRGEPDGTWHVQPVRDTAAGAALVDVTSLSWYAIGVCTPGDAGVFGFGIGDCPANHELKLEYLDGNGVDFEVPRDALGYAKPFLPDITEPTDVRLRVSWHRPAGLDRTDGVFLSSTDNGYLVNEQVNQQTYSKEVMVRLDPQNTPGAGNDNGTVRRMRARADYCWVGFIVGRGDNQSVCWNFDTDLAFKLHDPVRVENPPTINPQPVNVSVYNGSPATFHVDGLAGFTLYAQWLRKDLGSTADWAPAAGFPSGGTSSNGGRDFTLTTDQRRDNGAQFRAHVCDSKVSGQEKCVDSDWAQLTVSDGGGLPLQWTLQPRDASLQEGETFDLTMTATAVPYATIQVHRVAPGGADTVVKVCSPPTVAIASASNSLPLNPTVCHYTQGPVAVSDSGTQFYGVASSAVDPTHPQDSNHVALTVKGLAVAPSIGTQPAPASVKVGDTAVFGVSASGTGALSYQWQYKAAAAASAVALSDHAAGAATSGVAGSGSRTLTISNAQTADAGSYSVVVGNGTAPDATSQDAALTVTPPPPPLASAAALAASGYNTCAARLDGKVACWGDNSHGQLGNGSGLGATSPAAVPTLSGVAGVAVGQFHSCALKSDGTATCWGYNLVGQLGDGSTLDHPTPAPVPGLAGVVSLAAGLDHSCASLADGTLRCWGYNEFGQIGNGGNTNPIASPTAVTGLSGVTSVSAGRFHTCALRSNGSVVCWGSNSLFQLGDTSVGTSFSPIAVVGLAGVVKLAAGLYHNCAAKSDTSVVCWGQNDFGELGNGGTGPRSGPVNVSGLTGVVALTAGYSHSCAVKSDATVVCWGYNGFGQLGDGTTIDRWVPTAVPGLTEVIALAAGGYHTCALKTDGSTLCWGWNSKGQLGDGTTVDRHTPTAVLF